MSRQRSSSAARLFRWLERLSRGCSGSLSMATRSAVTVVAASQQPQYSVGRCHSVSSVHRRYSPQIACQCRNVYVYVHCALCAVDVWDQCLCSFLASSRTIAGGYALIFGEWGERRRPAVLSILGMPKPMILLIKRALKPARVDRAVWFKRYVATQYGCTLRTDVENLAWKASITEREGPPKTDSG